MCETLLHVVALQHSAVAAAVAHRHPDRPHEAEHRRARQVDLVRRVDRAALVHARHGVVRHQQPRPGRRDLPAVEGVQDGRADLARIFTGAEPFSRPSVCFARGTADGTYRARGDGGTIRGGADRRVEQVDDGEVPTRLREAHLVADQRARDLGPATPPLAEPHTLHRCAGLA